uniref:ArsA/GET3 Anion-transporting ATPase-like domain-containing protein n=1 Tax=Leersia perrieri TaxID=77586 RepID=A0A0D9W5T3_9ORYZ
MAALLNPTARRLALTACRRYRTPAVAAAAEPLVPHWRSQARYNSNLVEADGGFGEMVAGSPRYYVIGGKGGVGKTSVAASLAVKFANCGESTLIVSTKPHSLGDSFEQDMTGGKIVPVSGVDSLFAAEIGQTKEEPSHYLSWIRNIMNWTSLGSIVDLNALHEMLCKAPVAFSELMAIAQSHTLSLLRGTHWMEKSLSLLIKAMSATSSNPAVESTIGKDKINEQKQLAGRATNLFHDPLSVEFIIVTVPTAMAVCESSRFHASLKEDGVLVTKLVVNQVLPSSESDCRFWASKLKEETRVLKMISNDSELGGLKLIKAPLLDMELRGVPALKFLGDAIWK